MKINRNCPTLSLIFYADDAILFLKADLRSVFPLNFFWILMVAPLDS